MDLPTVKLLCLGAGRPSVGSTYTGLPRPGMADTLLRPLTLCFLLYQPERSKACIPVGGPKEDFATYVEWVLVKNDSPFTIGLAEEDSITSPTAPLPETSHPPPTATGTKEWPVPAADYGDWSTATDEPKPRKRLSGVITPEPGPQQESDWVLEPATSWIVEGVLVELEGWERSLHNTPLWWRCDPCFSSVSRILAQPPSSTSSVNQLQAGSSHHPLLFFFFSFHALLLSLTVYGVRMRLPGGGANVTCLVCVSCVFACYMLLCSVSRHLFPWSPSL